jgi:PAS domain S-box-containing protein
MAARRMIDSAMTSAPAADNSAPGVTTAAVCVAVTLLAGAPLIAGRLGATGTGDAEGWTWLTATAAAGAVLCAGALWLLRSPRHGRAAGLVASVCAALVVLLAGATLWELAAGSGAITDLLALETGASPAQPMPAGDAIMLATTGVGLLLLSSRNVRASRRCAVALGLTALVALHMAIYERLRIYDLPHTIASGLPSVLTFFLLAVGLVSARSRGGVAAVLASDRADGQMIRRLWLPLLVLTVLVGWLVQFQTLVIVLWVMVLSSLLLWRNARSLSALDAQLRRTTEAELLLRRQASLFDQAYEGMVISRWNGPIVFWNRGAAQLYGFSQEQSHGRLAHELLATRAAGGVEQLLEQLQRDRHWEGELRQRHRDGREIIVDARMTIVEDEHGTFVVTASRDITQRVEAAAALRDSERRFREIAEWLPQLVWTCEPNGWCDFLSQRWLDYTGATLAEELGYGWLQRLHPEDQDRVMAAWQAAVQQATHFDIEFRIRRRDGVYRWFDTRALALRDDAGRVVKWFGSNTDIEDQRAIREQLRANEERLSLALEINESAAWDLDLNTGELNRTVDHDRIFGYETLQPDWTMERFLSHVAAEDRDRIRHRFERTVSSSQDTWNFDCRIRRQDGAIRWIAVRGRSKRDESGRVVKLSGVVQDVTARKLIEEEVIRLNADLEGRVEQRTQELEAANRELEAFSYSVSHDLRAPLRTVDGFSQALVEDFGPVLPEEAQRYLRIVKDGAQRMGRLIDDLLAFSRLSRQPINAGTIDMHALACETWQEVAGQAPARTVEIALDPIPAASGDPALLRQVWLNLLSNALKYSRGREPARIHVGSLPGARAVYFVRDNGTGFDMQYAHKLFGVFQRLHRPEDFEGTGVGLAVVQRIIHRHGGRIWADAAPDQGATFFFTLGADGPSS